MMWWRVIEVCKASLCYLNNTLKCCPSTTMQMCLHACWTCSDSFGHMGVIKDNNQKDLCKSSKAAPGGSNNVACVFEL